MKWISKLFFFLSSIVLITKELILFGWGWYHFVISGSDMGWWSFNSTWGIVQWVFWQLFLFCFFIATTANLFAKK